MAAARLKDIAAAAGVDIGTVSHVLNHRPKSLLLRAETRSRIERIAVDLGYCRNELAASMSRRRGKVLAFVTSEMGSIEYTGRIQNGVFSTASAADYSLSLHHFTGRNAEKILQKILGWQTAGVIFHTVLLETVGGIAGKLKEYGIPFGFANLSHPDGLGVTTDDRQGILAALEHVRSCGCCRPAFLTYRHTRKVSLSEYLCCREQAYEEGMRTFFPGQAPVYLSVEGWSSGDLERQQYLDQLSAIRTGGLDAVLCISDLVAFKLLQQAQKAGLRVPGDVHLIGFGDLALASLCEPALSSISQDFEQMGGKIARLLIDTIENKSIPNQKSNLRIPVKLVLRESSPAPKPGVQP